MGGGQEERVTTDGGDGAVIKKRLGMAASKEVSRDAKEVVVECTLQKLEEAAAL